MKYPIFKEDFTDHWIDTESVVLKKQENGYYTAIPLQYLKSKKQLIISFEAVPLEPESSTPDTKTKS